MNRTLTAQPSIFSFDIYKRGNAGLGKIELDKPEKRIQKYSKKALLSIALRNLMKKFLVLDTISGKIVQKSKLYLFTNKQTKC